MNQVGIRMASADIRFMMSLKGDLPISPRSSSGEANSPRGTPDAGQTVPASEDCPNGPSTLPQKLTRPVSLTPPAKSKGKNAQDMVASDRDPFVTPGRNSKTRLSPTASAFSPWSDIRYRQQGELSGPISAAFSKDLGVSRSLSMSSNQHFTASDVHSWLQAMETNGLEFYGKRDIRETRTGIRVQFSDIRDASRVCFQLQQLQTDWRIEYLTAAKEQMADDDDGECREEEGQVVALAMLNPGSSVNAGHILASIQSHLQENGCLFAMEQMDSSTEGAIQVIAEFCDVSSAKAALAKPMARLRDENIQVIVTNAKDQFSTLADTEMRTNERPARSTATLNWGYGLFNTPGHQLAAANMCLSPQVAMYPMFFSSTVPPTIPYVLDSFVASPQGSTPHSTAQLTPGYRSMSSPFQTPPSPALTVQKNFSPSRSMTKYNRLDSRRQHALRVNRSPYQSSSSNHNHVDVDRIREGIDVRTTIMLRNIPNKVDQTMLKRIVDESSWGKYDFMYLRIDFANDCNVGYAFINFVDPLDITDFVEARGNQRWNCFKSDKVAEISYATIQGKDCLVQKFRNSSVMLEAAHYRPKLYFTSNGPAPEMAGQEEPFPDPDNQSKMKRSCENAEHVGLFTPNAGQHFRDEQRRRRSQYDRGTRLAALEEYDYEAALQQFQGIKLQ